MFEKSGLHASEYEAFELGYQAAAGHAAVDIFPALPTGYRFGVKIGTNYETFEGDGLTTRFARFPQLVTRMEGE